MAYIYNNVNKRKNWREGFVIVNSMKQVQKQVDEWVKQYRVPYWQPLEIMARITEEMGELARELNHRYGPKKKKSTEDTREICEEIGDIVFSLACLANSLELDIEDGFKKVMEKYRARDGERFERTT